MNKLFLIVCIFLIPIIPSSADYISLDNLTFDLGNGAYISIPYTFNATNFTLINGQLQVYLNNSQLQWRTSSNKTLTNIKIDNVSDEYSFTGSGTSGYLSFSSTMNNASSNYSFWLDNFFNSYANSTIDKQVTFNYTAAWSSHDFVINSSIEPVLPSGGLVVTTDSAIDITANGATLHGSVIGVTGKTFLWFEYGTNGLTYPFKTSNQSTLINTSFSARIYGEPIQSKTKYYYRAVAYYNNILYYGD